MSLYIRQNDEIEQFRKLYENKTEAELIAIKGPLVPHAPQCTAIAQILDARAKDAAKATREAEEAMHKDIKEGLDALQEPKFHWSTTPTFWAVVATLIVTILAWLFPRH